ncbi:sigma-70 family RNA polymerase sigma factor [Nocardia colli]|uniref:sigma-70 family RNA polymerase sigma factor n=1 Tax=Nocardia colli TaxID=2545717 RepID=UPI0035E26EAD
MDAVAEGDRHALGMLYDELAPAALGVAMAVLGDRAQSEIIVADVFAELWQTARRYRRAEDGPRSRVVASAHRRAVEQVRSTRSAASLPPTRDVRPLSSAALESPIGQQIPKRMLELPDDERQPVVLAYYGGYTYREIAEILDITLEITNNRIRAGLLRLRR